jgi:hypothetical protein
LQQIFSRKQKILSAENFLLKFLKRYGIVPFSTVVKAKTAATPSLQGINAVSGGGRMLYEKTILKDF